MPENENIYVPVPRGTDPCTQSSSGNGSGDGSNKYQVHAVSGKLRLIAGEYDHMYTCPPDRGYSIIDLTFCYDVINPPIYARLNIYLCDDIQNTGKDRRNLIMEGLEIGSDKVFPELSEVVIGPGQSVWLECVRTGPVNIHLAGLEHDDPTMVECGRLTTVTFGANETKLFYDFNNPVGAYMEGTGAFFNNTPNTVTIVVFKTDHTSEVKPIDKVHTMVMKKDCSAFLENIRLAPGQRLYINCDQAGIFSSLNGRIIGG